MVSGHIYSEEELRTTIAVEANIVTDKVLTEQIETAVREGIIMQSFDGARKRIYVRPVVQTELQFQ